ncbi:ribonuclease P protein component [Leifsonia sp. L25]|uniref:ribonuclease P protein component n=1 Tax=Leifsonia sp. L25 TaxID=3423957 RepID=UPI003D6819A4
MRRGARFTGAVTITSIRPNADSDVVRFGFIVSKSVGNAVTRNRVRRRLKAAAYDLLPGSRPSPRATAGWMWWCAHCQPPFKHRGLACTKSSSGPRTVSPAALRPPRAASVHEHRDRSSAPRAAERRGAGAARVSCGHLAALR